MDELILVDEWDRELGFLDKTQCHQGSGILHRAFSILLFNERDELLIQQRSRLKRLWPMYWSNSCCSHPRPAETMSRATGRRLREELGIACPLRFLFKFQYQAQFDPEGAENELCSVYIGRTRAPVRAEGTEICAWRWISPERLQIELAEEAEKFTPWFRIEWERVWREHRADVLALQLE